MEPILKVANWFLSQEPMTHKKLQQLCYYAEAWSFALLDRPLVKDDFFEAWDHGPVSPKLFTRYQGSYWKALEPDPNVDSAIEDPDDLWILESVWLTYGEMSGNALEALAQSEDPWIKAHRRFRKGEFFHPIIDPKIMKDYYQSIAIIDAV